MSETPLNDSKLDKCLKYAQIFGYVCIPLAVAFLTYYLHFTDQRHLILSEFQNNFADEDKRLFAVLSLNDLDREIQTNIRYYITFDLMQIILTDYKHILKMSTEEMDADRNCRIFATNFALLCKINPSLGKKTYAELSTATANMENQKKRLRRSLLLKWLPRQSNAISDPLGLTSALISTM